MNSKYVFIPSNLDMVDLLKENPPRFSNYNIDYFYQILGQLTYLPSLKTDTFDNGNQFVNLSASILQSYCHSYKQYLSYLIENEVIITDDKWCEGIKCTGYQYAEKYRSTKEFKRVDLTYFTLIKSLNKFEQAQRDSASGYKYLNKWFNDDLKIDKAVLEFNKNDLYKYNFIKDPSTADIKLHSYEESVKRFISSPVHYGVDATSGRYHSHLTNIKSQFRNFVSYSGQSLASVDLKNSQPLITGALLKQEFYSSWSKKSENLNLEGIVKKRAGIKGLNRKTIKQIREYITLVEYEQTLGREGFQEYIFQIESGNLYDDFRMHLFNQTGKYLESRYDIKKQIFMTYYSENSLTTKAKKVFRNRFSSAYHVFETYKNYNYKLLSILMQSVESILFLDYIAKRISIECPWMPIYTIHDSIVCPESEALYVKNVITEEIQRAIHMNPTLEIDVWKPEFIKFK